jgi:hypothetical protein
MLSLVRSIMRPQNEWVTSRKLFFMHIPKCGGVSISQWLRTLYDPHEICPISKDGGWRTPSSGTAAYRLFAGHFDINFVESVDPSGIKLTVIRDPIQRVVSLYDFWRSIDLEWADTEYSEAPLSGPRYASSMSFSTFIRSENPNILCNISDVATRQLLGSRFEMLQGEPSAAVRQAVSTLSSFDWFTTTNRLSTAIEKLASKLGVSPPHQLHLNQTYEPEPGVPRSRVHRTCLRREDVRHLMALNSLDLALYRAADLRLRTGWWRHCSLTNIWQTTRECLGGKRAI